MHKHVSHKQVKKKQSTKMSNLEILFGGIALVLAIVGVIYQITDSRNKRKITEFSGRIESNLNESKDTEKFTKFILDREGKIIHLDICLDIDRDHKIDENGIFSFSYFGDSNNKKHGGFSIDIKVNEEDDFFYDSRASSKRLLGNFKVLGMHGPRQGWMTILMKPVRIETI